MQNGASPCTEGAQDLRDRLPTHHPCLLQLHILWGAEESTVWLHLTGLRLHPQPISSGAEVEAGIGFPGTPLFLAWGGLGAREGGSLVVLGLWVALGQQQQLLAQPKAPTRVSAPRRGRD